MTASDGAIPEASGDVPNNEEDQRQRYGEIVGNEYEADVYFYSGPVGDVGLGRLTKEITRGKCRDKALLILTTNGGTANAAYQIARLLHKTYGEFILFTPSYCKSAGTIIALGAHRLIMDTFSELGPLDVQLSKENEISAARSGLLSRASFENLQEIAFDLFEHFMLKIVLSSMGP
jgi:ClpP class serine protease